MKSIYFLISLLFSTNLFAEDYSIELISALGADQKALSEFQNSYAQAKLQHPEQLELLMCMESKIDLELMQNTLAPLYANKYTESEAKEIISFFNSELGERIKQLSSGQLTHISFEKALSDQDKEKLKQMETGLLNPNITRELGQEFHKVGRALGKRIGLSCQ